MLASVSRSHPQGVGVQLYRRALDGSGRSMPHSEAEGDDLQRLVDWYQGAKRDLPWRRTDDPYRIWLSETMLQQTRVETVIPYYHAFLSRFPTVGDLAAAAPDEVAKLWQGLGYYARARNLHRAAQQVVSKFGGVIPSNPEDFSSLPGVGPYTAGAVLSIAFGQPTPAVDGNVLRVMARFLGIADPVRQPAVKRRIEAVLQAWLEQDNPRVVTQAVMELGATVCVPTRPDCGACPLLAGCAARAAGRQTELPVKSPKPRKQKVRVLALWCEADGQLLVQRRPAEGLLAGMWQLPAIEMPVASAEQGLAAAGPPAPRDDCAVAELLAVLSGRTRQPDRAEVESNGWLVELAVARHVFTHLEWEVHVLRPVAWTGHPDQPVPESFQWVAMADLPQLVWPRVYERLLEQLLRPFTAVRASAHLP